MHKEWKWIIPKKRFLHSDHDYKNESTPKNFVLTRERNLLQSLKNFAQPNEYKFTLQWLRPKLLLLNLQYDPWKIHFIVTWKIMDTSTFNCLNSSQPRIPKKMFGRLYTKEWQEFRLFVHSVQQATTGKMGSPSLKVETELAIRSMTYPQDVLQTTIYIGHFRNYCNFFQETCSIRNRRWTGCNYLWQLLSKRVDRSRLLIESVTLLLVSNISAHLFFRKNTQLFYTLYTGTNVSGRSMRACSFVKTLLVNVPNCHAGKVHVFW